MNPDRRTFLRATAALLGAIGLPGWAIGELQQRPRLLQLLAAPAAMEDSGVLRLLQRTSFGVTAAELERAAALGAAGYLDEQLHPQAIDDSALHARLAALTTLDMDGATLLRQEKRVVVSELQQATLLRASFSRRQLYEVLVDFWSNHFNIHIGKGNCRLLKTLDDREAIRPHVLGSFRELLGASAHSPAMLIFLDNRRNGKAAPNENYARELMELHTLGVDGGYGEADVAEVARCLTGWTIRDGAFFFARRQHDRQAKNVLGVTIAAGGGVEDGERVLDLLAEHPSTAAFIAAKLCRRFVADNPPAAAVEQVAAVFRDTRGDLGEVTRAVLSPPVFDSAGEPKLKRPIEYAVASLRALQADSDGDGLAKHVRGLGQVPFGAPSPAGYPEHAAAWLSTSGMLSRWNWALQLAGGKIRGVSVDLAGLGQGSTAAERAGQLVSALLPGLAGAELQAQLAQFLGGEGASAEQLEQRTPIAAGLVLGSPLAQYR